MTIQSNSAGVTGLNFQNQTSGSTQVKKHRPQPNLDQLLNQLTADLNLTDDQKTQISQILQNYLGQNQSNDEADNNSSAPKSTSEMQSKRAEMQSKMSRMNDAIKKVLTSDQATKFQTLLEQMQADRAQRQQQTLPQPTINSNGGVDFLA
jgi:Spy/CpxP family protein refolding chaperone